MTTDLFRNPHVPIAARVDDLLRRMTLEEKLAQIGSLWLIELIQGDHFDADYAAGKLEHGIGHVTRIGASTGLRPEASARLMNQIQRVAVERTRLGIPVMVHEESVAGYCARDATQFPQAIGLASSWDESLLFDVADAIRRQMVAVGARQLSGARPRRGPRCPLGARRGDLRRGPVSDRPSRDRVRARTPGRRPSPRGDRHRQTLSRLCTARRRDESRPGPTRTARAARGVRRTVRGSNSRRRPGIGDELVLLRRWNPVCRKPRHSRRPPEGRARFRRRGGSRLLRRPTLGPTSRCRTWPR